MDDNEEKAELADELADELESAWRASLARDIAREVGLPTGMITLDFLDDLGHWGSVMMLRGMIEQHPRLQHSIAEYQKIRETVDTEHRVVLSALLDIPDGTAWVCKCGQEGAHICRSLCPVHEDPF